VRTLAGILVISGLGALSLAGLAQHDLGIAGPSIALAALWGLSIALRWPKTSHTACLGASASLCALSVILKMPVLIPLFCLSASLCAWDLALMDLRLRSHPRQATFKLSRQYAIRCLSLAGVGGGVAILARAIHVQLSFSAAFFISCLSLSLFLVIHRRTQHLLEMAPLETKEARTAEPPALNQTSRFNSP